MRSSFGLLLACATGIAASALIFAGCTSDAESVFSGVSTTGTGGNGGEGGQGGATSSSSSASSSSSSTSSASSSSSTSASSSSSGGFDPQACGTCAWQSCQAQILACGASCQGFVTCSQSCADKPCVDACLQQYPQAQPVYDCTCASCSADCGSYCGGSSGSTSSSTSASSSSGATCAKCGDILQGSQDTPCQGSDTLANSLFTCTCQMNCVFECSSSCQGGQPSQACFGCVQQKCGMQLNACLQD